MQSSHVTADSAEVVKLNLNEVSVQDDSGLIALYVACHDAVKNKPNAELIAYYQCSEQRLQKLVAVLREFPELLPATMTLNLQLTDSANTYDSVKGTGTFDKNYRKNALHMFDGSAWEWLFHGGSATFYP